ncbi:MAG: hypothetical protein MN733_34295 [Nitrososphaera sp.]|nr:hypothetical protein [Nitrososphaera sp.]
MIYKIDQAKRSVDIFRSKVTIIAPILMFLSLGSLSDVARAANWYVRPNGTTYGSGNGTSWSNAISGFAGISWSSVSCGDAIWIAGGTYTQNLLPAKKCTSGARLAIRRARSDAPEVTSATGWSASFDASVHQTNGAGIIFNGDWDYITISGRTISAGGNHGWWIDFRGPTAGKGIDIVNGAAADYNTFEYMDLQGPGNINYTGDGRGIDATPFSSATGNVFSHMKIWEWESGVYHAGINGSTFEYLDMYDIHALNWATHHPNGIYCSSANNVIVRYSKFHKGPNGYGTGEGIFFEQSGGCNNWQIYGNAFYDLDYTGVKALNIASPATGLKILNNTFDNVILAMYIKVSCGAGSETRNNLFYAASPGTCGTMSNNLTLSSPSAFVNRATHDYHIVDTVGVNLPRNAGTSLSSYFQADMDGITFGTDGLWDIGAYEFSSTPSQSLAAPSNLRVQ